MAPLSQQAAEAAYLGAPVRKKFRQGWFNGAVTEVSIDLEDDDGVKWPLLFQITYSDGEQEDILLKELRKIMTDREAADARLAAALEAEHGASGSGDENAHGSPPQPQPKKRRTKGVLDDATDSRRNAAAPGEERRSRREPKRRMDGDFEYDQGRGAKRAAAGDGDGPPRARVPGRPTAVAAAAAAEQASESEEVCPEAGGMRSAGLPGHLIKIEAINFMCHEHFTMDFGKHVTFVSGSNGSGKSAVLQALQICLGVKASDTGRASSFKKLIKTGADEAILRVTVSNRPFKGFDAFRHSAFGDVITVERKIAASGASSYALKGADGRIYGRKRDDLDAMLATLGLNAANPICVMTQDTARNFLAGSSTKSDHEKFELYMEATSMDQIAYSLQISREQIRKMDEGVQQIRERYEGMKAEHSRLSKSIAALQGIQGWRTEAVQLEQVLNWAVVDEAAAAVAARAQVLQSDLPARLAAAQALLAEVQLERQALRQATEDKAQFLANYQQRAAALAAEVEGLKHAHKDAHRAVKLGEAKLARLRAALAEEQARKQTLEEAVREVEDELGTQAAVAAYQQQVQAAQAADEAARQEARAMSEACGAAGQAAKAAFERADALRREIWGADEACKGLQASIRELRDAGRSKLAAFGGRPVLALVQAIKQERGFSRPPIGPVGQHLTLEDSRWGMAVEAALGFSLDAFLVHSMADSHLLRRLINQHFAGQRMRPSVYVVNFDLPLHAVPAGAQPPAAVPTLYRLLSVGDRQLAAPILNNLVDTSHIERIAVAASNAECASVGWHTPNVMACYGANRAKYYKRGQNQTSIPPPHWCRHARLGQSAAQQTSELEAELRRRQEDLRRITAAHSEAQQQAWAAQEAERAEQQRLQAAKRREWQAGTALTQLTQAPPPELAATQEGEGEDAAQAEVWQATQACIDLEQQLRDRQAEVAEAQAAERAAHEALDRQKLEVQRLEEENEAFLSSFHREQAALGEKEEEAEAAAEEVEAMRARQAALAAQLERHQTELAAQQEMAEKVCSRAEAAAAAAEVEARLRAKGCNDEQIAELLSPQLLDKKIKQLERKVAEHEREAGGALDELQAQYAASQAAMQRDGARFRQAISTHQMVSDAYKLRKAKLRDLDHNLERLVNARFRHYMWKKGHTGMIKLDRKERSLQLKVQVNSAAAGGGGGRGGAGGQAGAEAAPVKDLKQLSGGERSYTTVAFTLALGAQTEMPFRVMDEFDVFMDAVNRRVAMQNLFSFALENSELQFIFLTPQDISAVEDARVACASGGKAIPDGFVRIVQMRPARANATHA